MEEELEDLGKRLDVEEDDIKKIRKRRILDMVILGISGSLIAMLSMLIGFGIGNSEKYGMAYYPYAFIPLAAARPDRMRFAIWGIGSVVVVLASVLMYMNGFEAGKVYYSNSILYGAYRRLP